MTESETRTEQVYRRLRADILGGLIQPGSQLAFAQLKNDYGASMGVLREALMRLSAEGLAINTAQRGFKVMELSLEDLADLTATRCTVESLVFQDSIHHGDIEWETRIIAAHHRMERTQKHEDGESNTVTAAWAQAHHDFHMALISAAKSRRMQAIASSLRAAAEVYRRWSMPFEMVKRDVSAEHLELMNLAIARKTEEAGAALVKHLTLTKTLIMDGVARSRQ